MQNIEGLRLKVGGARLPQWEQTLFQHASWDALKRLSLDTSGSEANALGIFENGSFSSLQHLALKISHSNRDVSLFSTLSQQRFPALRSLFFLWEPQSSLEWSDEEEHVAAYPSWSDSLRLTKSSFPRLEHLKLQNTTLERAVELLEGSELPLTTLELDIPTEVKHQTVQRFLRCDSLDTLQSLVLKVFREERRRSFVHGIFSRRAFLKLTSLSLSGFNMAKSGFEKLLSCQFAPHLTLLTLHRAGLNKHSMRSLEKSRPLRQLQSLDLSHNLIGNDGLYALERSGPWKELRHLKLNMCGFTHRGYNAFVRSDAFSRLETLESCGNSATSAAFTRLCAGSSLRSLRELTLSFDFPMRINEEALRQAHFRSTLESLKLKKAMGLLEFFAEELQHWPHLWELDWKTVPIPLEAEPLQSLLRASGHRFSLQELWELQSIEPEVLEVLAKSPAMLLETSIVLSHVKSPTVEQLKEFLGSPYLCNVTALDWEEKLAPPAIHEYLAHSSTLPALQCLVNPADKDLVFSWSSGGIATLLTDPGSWERVISRRKLSQRAQAEGWGDLTIP
jgi:hypothetical protein